MKKIIIISVIIVLIISTTITKNSTKNLDKQIYETKENIRILKEKYEYALLDFNYLSSPKKLIEYKFQYFGNNLKPIDIQKTKKLIFENNLPIITDNKNILND